MENEVTEEISQKKKKKEGKQDKVQKKLSQVDIGNYPRENSGNDHKDDPRTWEKMDAQCKKLFTTESQQL